MTTESAITGKGRKPRLAAPPGACECHSHAYEPQARFPFPPGRRLHADAPIEAYETMLARLGTERSVIVQPSAYGIDNSCTLDAIARMGLARARGIAVTRPDASVEEFERLHAGGIRAMRFFLFAPDLGLDVTEKVAGKRCELGPNYRRTP